jgi:hypothetical protein
VGGVVALGRYQVSDFWQGTSAYSQPDSIVADQGYVYVGYQNGAAKDGTDNKTSTVVQYTLNGKVGKTFTVPGHEDGLRVDPSTPLLWSTSNEGGNPVFDTIDPTSGTVTPYKFPPTPHGGGYDDLAFVNGQAFIATSNPNLNASGVNVFPALDNVTLSGSSVKLTPVLMGNASATVVTTNSKVALNEVDPDSLSIDPAGDLVLVNQAGSELVFLKYPGTPHQAITRVPVGTQLDDTVWATAARGQLRVADGTLYIVYSLRTIFPQGVGSNVAFTEAPDDSGLASFVGTVDVTTAP